MNTDSPTLSTRTKRILVVDDNADIRNLISLILTNESFEVLALESGVEFLERVASFQPDLVLLDIMMPHLSGFEILEAVRARSDSELGQVPIIMITAKSMDADIEKALQLGANSYLVKPFRAQALKEKVSTHIGADS